MTKNNIARMVSTGGILAALATLFQASPIFMPVIGLFLSPFSTLPIALAAASTTSLGITTLLSSAFILFLISPQEAAVFLFATGALGFALGISSKKKAIGSIGISAVTLFAGINIMIYIIGIDAFGSMTPHSSPVWGTIWILLFSVMYAGIWRVLLQFILRRTKS